MGASYKLTDDVTLSGAWMHGFRNSIDGPISQVPGSNTKLDAQVDSIVFGLNVTFGKKRKPSSESLPTLPAAEIASNGPASNP